MQVALARAPDFYGPEADVTAIYGERVFNPALAGKRVDVMGKLDVPHTFIALKDFARGMEELGEHSEAFGQAWHLPCAPTPTQRELLTLIFEEAGKPPRMGEAPSLISRHGDLHEPQRPDARHTLLDAERGAQGAPRPGS